MLGTCFFELALVTDSVFLTLLDEFEGTSSQHAVHDDGMETVAVATAQLDANKTPDRLLLWCGCVWGWPVWAQRGETHGGVSPSEASEGWGNKSTRRCPLSPLSPLPFPFSLRCAALASLSPLCGRNGAFARRYVFDSRRACFPVLANAGLYRSIGQWHRCQYPLLPFCFPCRLSCALLLWACASVASCGQALGSSAHTETATNSTEHTAHGAEAEAKRIAHRGRSKGAVGTQLGWRNVSSPVVLPVGSAMTGSNPKRSAGCLTTRERTMRTVITHAAASAVSLAAHDCAVRAEVESTRRETHRARSDDTTEGHSE
jgi:hypothetical protein